MKACPVCGAQYDDDALYCAHDRTVLKDSDGPSSLVGVVLDDRYRIVRHLATGGMGQVYLGEHIHIGRQAAIKVIAAKYASDPDAATRFQREAKSAAQINHPNVCAIYDYGVTLQGLPYIAMEYVEGRSVADLLTTEGRLPLARSLAIIAQCASGLQAAHDHGIVHRDLKPENILLQESSGDQVKLVDFGIAKAMGDVDLKDMTRQGVMVGTPAYMAPEQIAGDPVDGRTDGYALALVCYRMVTGTHPFPATTTQEVMTRRLTEPPASLAVAAPSLTLPSELEAVLQRGLARLPRDRFQSVEAFAEALAKINIDDSEAETVLLPRPTLVGGWRRWSFRRIGAALIILAVGTWIAFASGGRLAPDGAGIGDATGRDSTNSGTADSAGGPQVGEEGRPRTVALNDPAGIEPVGQNDTSDSPERTILPHIDSILAGDSGVRARASRQNERLLLDSTISNATRASAALGLAQTARLEGRLGDEVHYLEQAYQLNPLPRYRTELDNARKRMGSNHP